MMSMLNMAIDCGLSIVQMMNENKDSKTGAMKMIMTMLKTLKSFWIWE